MPPLPSRLSGAATPSAVPKSAVITTQGDATIPVAAIVTHAKSALTRILGVSARETAQQTTKSTQGAITSAVADPGFVESGVVRPWDPCK